MRDGGVSRGAGYGGMWRVWVCWLGAVLYGKRVLGGGKNLGSAVVHSVVWREVWRAVVWREVWRRAWSEWSGVAVVR